MWLSQDDPLAGAVGAAIRAGDVAALRELLADTPGLASARIAGRQPGGFRTPLHVATDWPGFFPNGRAVVALLVEFGGDPDAGCEESGGETPLHWAASNDDVEVLDALLDAGADIEVPGASIGGGTPLDDAIGYGQWQVARRLVERGARVDRLWHAAALGMTARMEELLAATPPPTAEEISDAFWQACHGGQRRTAELLLARGASIDFTPWHNDTSAVEIAANADGRREPLVQWLRKQGARASAPAS